MTEWIFFRILSKQFLISDLLYVKCLIFNLMRFLKKYFSLLFGKKVEFESFTDNLFIQKKHPMQPIYFCLNTDLIVDNSRLFIKFVA